VSKLEIHYPRVEEKVSVAHSKLNEALDQMLIETGGETGRDFTPDEREFFDLILTSSRQAGRLLDMLKAKGLIK
jgi:hypothetical protein